MAKHAETPHPSPEVDLTLDTLDTIDSGTESDCDIYSSKPP